MTIIQAAFGSRKKDSEKKKKQKNSDTPAPLYQFHVSLSFSDPLIWRRIIVPGELTLSQMHDVLQVCMEWSGESNHQFYVGKVFYDVGKSGPGRGDYHETDFDLQQLEEAMKWCFTYMYDAGDGWEHEIILEDAREQGDRKKVPEVIDGEWASPPEQIGSVHRYTELIHALEHPELEASARLLQQHDMRGFDHYRFDLEALNSALAADNWVTGRQRGSSPP